MGTTRDALIAGSARTVRVLAIEGCKYLVAESDVAAVATAYAGLVDFTEVLGGLFCDVEDDQRLHPYEPLGSGGRCVIRVAPDALDQFGKYTHRRIGAETLLTATIDRDDTTIPVASTTSFAASGEVHIGTECIAYTSKDATNLLGCTRGKYSPVWTANATPTRFAHDHRVMVDPNSALIKPVVSAVPRVWIGRWATVYEHRVVGGVLDTVAEAERVFSGRIADLTDDGKFTCIELKHVLDVVKESSVLRSPFSAVVKEGLYLFQPQEFRILESDDFGATFGSPQSLFVKNTPTATNHIQAGYYTSDELRETLTNWLAQLKSDGDIDGEYVFALVQNGDQEFRISLQWRLTGSPAPRFVFHMPDSVIRFFGYNLSQFPSLSGIGAAHHFANITGSSATYHAYVGETTPLRSFVDKFTNGGDNANLNFEVEDERGSFVEQFASMPQSARVGLLSAGFDSNGDPLQWGLFMFDDKAFIRAAYRASTHEILSAVVVPGRFGSSESIADLEHYSVSMSEEPRDITLRQILVLEAPAAEMLKLLFYSTGTLAHNHDTLDNLPFGVGLGIPGGLLGDDFEASLDALPGADIRLAINVDKPTTIAELLGGDLQLRRAFLFWKRGTLRFGSWRAPAIADAVATLDESNKAVAAGASDDHRATSRESDEWVYPVVKIYFDRDLTDIQTESFRGILTIEDSTSVDDAGGDGRTLTVKSRNTFADTAEVGASVKDLLSNYLGTFSMFSRAQRIVTRSISPKLYEALSVGDVVTIEDEHARDPVTGERGLSAVAALVVGKRCSRGGAQADSDTAGDAAGTVDLFFTESSPQVVGAAYVPTADVDETHTTGAFTAGYDSAGKVLYCYSYRYSDDGTVVAPVQTDAERTGAVGYRVRIEERDPADPTAPQSWDDTVAAQSGDTITLTTGLAGFDTTKRYRVIFDDYGDATAAQRALVFQADETDNLVVDTVAAYQYASWPAGTSTYVANMNSTIGIELPADSTAIDGAGRDVGTEQAIARLLDMHIDYNSALSLPVIDEVLSNENDVSGTWQLLQCRALYLTDEILSGDVWRELSMSPWFRSVDGRMVHLRATLTRTKPSGSSVMDVNRGAIISAATWTTTSTTWDDGTRIEVDCRVKDFTGKAWLLVEATLGCETRGMNRVGVGPRLYDNTWWIP